MSGPLILVVDGPAQVSGTIPETLKCAGYMVVAIPSAGKGAIETAHRLKPDLIVMSADLTGTGDGLEAAAAIREFLPSPIVFLTSRPDDEAVILSRFDQPCALLAEPFSRGELLAAVNLARHFALAETRLKERVEILVTALAAISDAVVATDRDGRITYLNPLAEKLTGFCLDAARNEPLEQVVRLADGPARQPLNLAGRVLAAGGKTETGDDVVLLTPDGQTRPVSAACTAVWGRSGDVPGAVLVIRDMSHRKQAENALEASEARFRRMFEDAVLGIFRADAEGRFIDVNPAFAAMFGYGSPEELLADTGRSAERLNACPARPLEIVDRILRSGRPIETENEYQRRDGSRFTGALHAWPLWDDARRLVCLDGFVEDISPRINAEQERARLMTQLHQTQKMEAIGTLAGGIAHDFNNILAAIIGYAELAMAGISENDPCWKEIGQILKSAMRAKDLVRQILTFSRQQDLEKKPADLAAIMREGLSLLRASIPATIDIRQAFSAETAPVEADQTQMHQLLMNLCTNAAQAMEGSSGILTVLLETIALSEKDAGLDGLPPGRFHRLTVSDTGKGIPPEVADHIFEPFFTTKKDGRGTGLGLAVAHNIVKNHDGVIHFDSIPGEGTVFTVLLPALEQPPMTTAPTISRTADKEGSGRLLFVDDEPDLANLARLSFGRMGFSVTSLTSGREALALFRQNPAAFDLVITDLTMPHMTGLELAGEMLKLNPSLPVILCTGYGAQEVRDRAREAGIARVITKPLSMRDLGGVIQDLLENRPGGPAGEGGAT